MTNTNLAFVFPGQGSQAVGMLAELGSEFSVVRDTFAEASGILGYDLWQLVQQGPDSELNLTDRTQPAMLTAGVATWRVWQQRGGAQPALLAGHSLGEYTALVCSGALAFDSAVALVEQRGRFMQQAVPEGQGAMAAILGLDDDQVRNVCIEAAQGDVVEAVNFNSPGQVVIAGITAAVQRAAELAKKAGAKRAVLLPVSAPSHCALMKDAAGQLAGQLSEIAFTTPQIPVINNVDVECARDGAAIRDALVRQLYNPVRWVETIHYMMANHTGVIVEAGPGKVLAGLCKRIDRSLNALPVYDLASLNQALNSLNGE